MEESLVRIIGYMLEPFHSQQAFITAISRCVKAFTSLESRTSWFYLLTSALIGAVIYAMGRRRGENGAPTLLRFLFPRDIYLHRSAIVDYKFFVFDQTVSFVFYMPLIAAFSMLAYKVAGVALGGIAGLGVHPGNTMAGKMLLPVVVILAADFGFFLGHYLTHKVPELWCFHEVHHSAEVLTPITGYRNHPIDELANRMVWGVFSGIGAALYTSKTGHAVSVPTMLGVNFIQFAFLVFAFQLRHSHIWLSYGPILSRIFISPSQHQIHHSVDSKHRDKNFGYIFSFWDLMFGTLYVPIGREQIVTGLVGANAQDFANLPRLYLLPFVKAARVVQERLRRLLKLAAHATG